jgi:hypothetical protein
LSVFRIEASYNPNPSYEADDSKSLMINTVVLGALALMSLY